MDSGLGEIESIVYQSKLGLDNDGNMVSKNRAWRRRIKNAAELDGKSRKFYTTKQIKYRKKKNGKKVKICKKSY